MAEYQYVAVAEVSELPQGERIQFEIDGDPIVLLNVSGKLYAVADLCTHDDGPLGDGEVIGTEIVCPRHGARFSLLDGRVTRLPAVEDIAWYPVRVQDGMIEIGLPVSA